MDIVTGDRDLFQLVDDARGVRVLYPVKGVGTLQRHRRGGAARRSTASTAAATRTWPLLRGDPSDGLPGVPGIGEKTAAQLLAEYGDLAGILAAVGTSAPGSPPPSAGGWSRRRDYLAVAPKVVRVALDVPLPPVGTALPHEPADPATLDDLAARWGLGSSLTRLLTSLAAADGS